ncbi:hypothetical protein HC251_01595 [Iamia sp. SCSIO 61187]|uniref:hypothetical protein n=1 Tax=Iamia sp. SCSIO 61187 TaxID=2722752 RepID=UPI001C635A85|nr:hypothetical protein [Iamia sp. SCSIO 61187]QYG91257.1 hypothetical protein HC251_01595 [Iamia sp. SCSIO 61187]
MANGNDETTDDLIEGTKQAKEAAKDAVADTEDDAQQLQEELDRRSAEQPPE